MSNILYVDDEENQGKVDIDALFEKKQQRDMKQLSIFNKILNRIHKRITHNGRIKSKETYVFFTVPEYIFGEPLYNQGDCVGYLVVKLQDNGFHVRYIHPNTLFISWGNWIPSYVRNEIKKKTGMIIDGYGNEKIKTDDRSDNQSVDNSDPNALIFGLKNKSKNVVVNKKNNGDYKDIDSYKPSGNLIYNKDLLRRIQDKSSKN